MSWSQQARNGVTVLEDLDMGPFKSASDAVAMFGDSDLNCVPLILRPRRGLAPFITIPSGCYALVSRFGERIYFDDDRTRPWPTGFHYALPSVTKISHLVSKQAIVFDAPVQGCKTKDNVTVTVDLAIVLRIMGDPLRSEDPKLVEIFVDNLGPASLMQQMTDAQEEAVRHLVRSVNHDQVYNLRHLSNDPIVANVVQAKDAFAQGSEVVDAPTRAAAKFSKGVRERSIEKDPAGNMVVANWTKVLDKDDSDVAVDPRDVTLRMQRELNEQFNPFGVEILDVAIQSVFLPTDIHSNLEMKTTSTSEIKNQEMKQKNDIQNIQQEDEMRGKKQELGNKMEKLEAQGRKDVTVAKERLQSAIAESQKEFTKIKEEGDALVLGVQVKSARECGQIAEETAKLVKEIVSKANAEAEQHIAEANATIAKLNAETSLTLAKANAMKIELLAEAEGKAAQGLSEKRTFELNKKKLQVYNALASNKEVFVSGSKGICDNDLLADLLVSKGRGEVMLNVKS